MTSSRFCSALAVLALTASQATAAGWSVIEQWQDPIAGEIVDAATTTNDDGFSVYVFRSEGEHVFAIYTLPPSSFDRIKTDGLVMMIRPGNLASVDITVRDSSRERLMNTISNGRQVRASLWHGTDPAPVMGTLRNMLDSDQLDARFFLDDGGSVDTSWTLEGSADALATALNITTYVDPAEKEWASLEASTFVAASQQCRRNPATGSACSEAMVACSDVLTVNRDRTGYLACLKNKGF